MSIEFKTTVQNHKVRLPVAAWDEIPDGSVVKVLLKEVENDG